MPTPAVVVEFEADHFSGWAERKMAFPETVKPTGEKDRICIVLRTVVVCCKRSGSSFKFSGQRKGGVLTFGDSRYADSKGNGCILKPRYSVPQLRVELARMIGAENADKCLRVVQD
jgi:hypothetical protein